MIARSRPGTARALRHHAPLADFRSQHADDGLRKGLQALESALDRAARATAISPELPHRPIERLKIAHDRREAEIILAGRSVMSMVDRVITSDAYEWNRLELIQKLSRLQAARQAKRDDEPLTDLCPVETHAPDQRQDLVDQSKAQP